MQVPSIVTAFLNFYHAILMYYNRVAIFKDIYAQKILKILKFALDVQIQYNSWLYHHASILKALNEIY